MAKIKGALKTTSSLQSHLCTHEQDNQHASHGFRVYSSYNIETIDLVRTDFFS